MTRLRVRVVDYRTRDVLQQRKRELPIWLRLRDRLRARIIDASRRRAIDGVVVEGPGLLALHDVGRGTCVEIKILRRVRAESSRRPPRHRRDACTTHGLLRAQVPRPTS